MFKNARTCVGIGGLAIVFLLQGCGKSDDAPKVEATAASVPVAAASATAHSGKPSVEMAVAVDSDTKPATSFSADTPKLIAFVLSKGTKAGDVLGCTWIAEDVGTAAPKGTKIEESTFVGDKVDFSGGCSLSKPTNGWPIGQYRVDAYVGTELAGNTKFSIE